MLMISRLNWEPALNKMVDRTPWVSKAKTPELALRQMLEMDKVAEPLRLMLADKNILTVDRFASIGHDQTTFRTNLLAIFGDALGEGEGARQMSATFLTAVWRKADKLAEVTAQRRAKLEEDPHKIPEIPAPQYADMRARFAATHPDVLLSMEREPHKKLIERLLRDWVVGGSLPYYELGEVRLRSEKIVARSGLQATADRLLKLAEEDQAAKVDTDEDCMNRIHAFAMALEYTGICPYRSAAFRPGSYTGGMFAYMAELSRRRRDLRESLGVSPLLFTVEADKRVRSMVARFTMEDREVYTDYETALRAVLESHAYLGSDARETVAAGQRQRATTPPRDRTKKNKFEDEDEEKEDKQPKKKKSRVQRLREKLDLLQQGSGKSKQDGFQGRQQDRDRRGQGQDRQADRHSKGSGKGTTDGRKLAPEKLWTR